MEENTFVGINGKALSWACKHEDLKIIKSSLSRMKKEEIRGSTADALFWACLNIKIFKLLLPYLNAEDIRKQIPVIFPRSCEHGHTEVVKLLLPYLNPLFVNRLIDEDFKYGFRYACENKHIKTVKLLIAHLIKDDIKNREDIWIWDSVKGERKLIELLLSFKNKSENIIEKYVKKWIL